MQKTPTQFADNNGSSKFLDTDEDGNRLSIRPGSAHPNLSEKSSVEKSKPAGKETTQFKTLTLADTVPAKKKKTPPAKSIMKEEVKPK